MTTETSIPVATMTDFTPRSGEDRRAANERRRSAKGLFELRARREGVDNDRRRIERRGEESRPWFAFWRKGDTEKQPLDRE